jgi:hypothetical protein
MLIHSDPDAWMPISEHHTCLFHKDNPGKPFAGCTCSGMIGHRPATEEERAENRRRRLERELADAERALASIRAQLGLTP